MSEERPETCAMCGAPVVWCKCGMSEDIVDCLRDLKKWYGFIMTTERMISSNQTIEAAAVEIERLTAELAALRERVRWIPVSERLPDFLTPTLTVYRTKTGISAITLRYRLDEYFWIDEEGNKVPKKNVTHWMPLPKPPEEQE